MGEIKYKTPLAEKKASTTTRLPSLGDVYLNLYLLCSPIPQPHLLPVLTFTIINEASLV